jgi:pimeloyl-ACP methyl ester carboxylesterase
MIVEDPGRYGRRILREHGLAYQEAGTGTPVVLLHAFPLSAQMWQAQLAGLADACRVVTPDLRGFGGSPLDGEEPSLDLMADDVAALLDRLALNQVVLSGISMGGYVVMAFLRRHADRVRAVVLADTKAGADPEPARENRLRIARVVLGEAGLEVLVEDVLPGLLGVTTKSQRPDVLERVRKLTLTADPAGVAWAQRAMAARPDSFETLRGVDLPALVVVGEEDELSPPTEAQAMVDALKRARLATIPAAGHLSAIENPDRFNAVVREFVKTAVR